MNAALWKNSRQMHDEIQVISRDLSGRLSKADKEYNVCFKEKYHQEIYQSIFSNIALNEITPEHIRQWQSRIMEDNSQKAVNICTILIFSCRVSSILLKILRYR